MIFKHVEPKKIKEIGVGVIGYGIGRIHAHAWINMPYFYWPPPAKAKLVAAGARTETKVKEFSERYGFKKYYTDCLRLAKDPEIEVLDNCAPPATHADPCIMAAEAGKHVICEKPLARTAQEARKMLDAAERAGIIHMTAFNKRFMPAVQLARRLITEGYIGEIHRFRTIYTNIEFGDKGFMDANFPLIWMFRKEISGYGALSDIGSHVLDMARFLIGEISQVCAATDTLIEQRPLPEDPGKKGDVNVDDITLALLKFKNGVLGTFEASWLAPEDRDRASFEIGGSKGCIRFSTERMNELEFYSIDDQIDLSGFRNIKTLRRQHPMMEKFWIDQGGGFGLEHTFINEIHHFVDCVANNKPVAPIGATFYDGYKVCQIMDAMIESAKRGRWTNISSP